MATYITIESDKTIAYQIDGQDKQALFPNISGDGEVSDYADLTNKPSINSVTLSGNKTSSDLGVLDAPATAGTEGQVLGLDSNLAPVWINQSGGTSETWELIKDYTPTADLSVIYINTDENGQPFSLKKCLVCGTLRPTDNTNDLPLAAGFNKDGQGGNVDFTAIGKSNYANSQWWNAYAESNGFFRFSKWLYPAGDINTPHYIPGSSGQVQEIYTLESGSITSFAVRFQAGNHVFDTENSQIKIYGVRA